jgi:hypothetical protein
MVSKRRLPGSFHRSHHVQRYCTCWTFLEESITFFGELQMSNIRTRLERLEKRQNGTSFSFWDCLAGLKPPPGWQPPEDIAKALAELPDSVPDHVEDLIYQDG